MATTIAHPPQTAPAWTRRDLLRLEGLSAGELRALLERTRYYAMEPRHERFGALMGRFVANVFFEDSTRTRMSFDMAAHRLSATTLTLAGDTSSVKKGETLADTGRVLEAQGADALIIRCSDEGGAEKMAHMVGIPVINAGDGAHEHPTQGLLDIYTTCEAFDRLETFDMTGLTIVIVGDIQHSRVARSDVFGMTTLGARVVCVGPPHLCPPEMTHLGCEIGHDLDKALAEADAVQMLRMQFERGTQVDSLPAYREAYQLNEARAEAMRPDAIVMHPGPMNRGVEITSAVADGPRSRVFRQNAVGVYVRMAALESCISAHQRGAS
jgi:aspartate carbamoyltransferase catalytic subunit